MPMSITITKSTPVLVGPSSTAPAPAPVPEHISLSSFDKGLAFFPFMSFHVFNHGIPKPAETVRTALSHALTYYLPVAGRFVGGADDDDGELRIACTGEGVAFVAASANCSLEDVKMLDPPFATLLNELSAGRRAEGFNRSDPPMLIQVTEFSCGGFVVGVAWNHGIADGAGLAQFLQAVGELARGLPRPSIFPVSCGDDTLPEMPPSAAAMQNIIAALDHQDFAHLDITVPSSCINRIKAGFADHAGGGGEPCTVFEAVVAVLWQCRTRVVMSDPTTPAPLIFTANVRKHVGAKYGYYGNCVSGAVVISTSGEVANGDINDVVSLIKRAKHEVSCHFKNAGGGQEGGVSPTEKPVELDAVSGTGYDGYNAFVVSSWRDLGCDAVDFGCGRPARVMGRMDRTVVPNCIVCLPYEGKDGANVMAQCVKEEDVDAYLGELAKFV